MVGVKVFNTTFNNISVISYPVLFMEETGVPGETHRPDHMAVGYATAYAMSAHHH
jgi:hypothetical protein